jgi:hypothetical protein
MNSPSFERLAISSISVDGRRVAEMRPGLPTPMSGPSDLLSSSRRTCQPDEGESFLNYPQGPPAMTGFSAVEARWILRQSSSVRSSHGMLPSQAHRRMFSAGDPHCYILILKTGTKKKVYDFGLVVRRNPRCCEALVRLIFPKSLTLPWWLNHTDGGKRTRQRVD